MLHKRKFLIPVVLVVAGCSAESPDTTLDSSQAIALGAANGIETASVDSAEAPIISGGIVSNLAEAQAEAELAVEPVAVAAPEPVAAPELVEAEPVVTESEVAESEPTPPVVEAAPVVEEPEVVVVESVAAVEQNEEQVSTGSLAETVVELAPPAPAAAQPDLCAFPTQESVISADWLDPQPGIGLPGYRSSITEQNGHKVTRVSSNSEWGASYNGQAIHQYSKRQVWNADDTLMEIGGRTVDTSTNQLVNGLIPLSSARNWSNSDPDTMLGIFFNPLPNVFASANVRTGEVNFLREFGDYTSCTLGDFEGSVTNNDDKVVLACDHRSTGARTLISYDIANDTVLGTMNPKWDYNWASFSPSGEYIVLENNAWPSSDARELVRFDPDFSNRFVLADETEHGDFGVDENGDEVYAMLRWDIIFYVRLKDGSRVDMTVSSSGNSIGNGHISCRNAVGRPGWCYVTSYNKSRIMAIKISENAPAAELWGYHRSGIENYYSTPKGSASRNGDKIIFTSHWYNQGEINDYLMECNAL